MAKENDAGTKAGACPTMSHAEIDQTLSETFSGQRPTAMDARRRAALPAAYKQSEQAQKDREQE